MQLSGKKEIKDAVIIAGLSALASGIMGILVKKIEKWFEKEKKDAVHQPKAKTKSKSANR